MKVTWPRLLVFYSIFFLTGVIPLQSSQILDHHLILEKRPAILQSLRKSQILKQTFLLSLSSRPAALAFAKNVKQGNQTVRITVQLASDVY